MKNNNNYNLNKIFTKAKQAIEILNQHGFEGFFVGGCVRDYSLGEKIKDFDITTNALPNDILEIFSNHKTIKTGIKHGTITVILNNTPIEITTYRIDGEYLDNRRPSSVKFSRSLKDDVSRRDFTVNSICMDSQGKFIDHFDGLQDIKNKIIRTIGNADERFKEDALRILRALRFASTFGFSIEQKTKEAMLRNKDLLLKISYERILNELTKILCGKNVFEVLFEYYEIVGVVIPEILPMIGFNQQSKYHCYDVFEHTLYVVKHSPQNPIMRWAALLHDVAKPHCFTVDEKGAGHFYGHGELGSKIAHKITKRLKFDKKTADVICILIAQHMNLIFPHKNVLKKFLAKIGEENLRMLIELNRADNMGQAKTFRDRQITINEMEEKLNAIIKNKECFSLKDIKIKGTDLLSLGFNGAEIGKTLNNLLEAVIEEKVENEKEKLLKYLNKSKKEKK